MKSNPGAQRFPIRMRHALQMGHKGYRMFRPGRMVQKTADQNGGIHQGKRGIQPEPGRCQRAPDAMKFPPVINFEQRAGIPAAGAKHDLDRLARDLAVSHSLLPYLPG